MIGLLVITHGQLAKELLEAAEFIVGAIDTVEYVAIDASKDSKKLRDIIQKKMKALDQGQGVLVLTDMFGGTPSNISLSFLDESLVEVITGVNLAMLIQLSMSNEDESFHDLVQSLKQRGQENIHIASEFLRQRGKK